MSCRCKRSSYFLYVVPLAKLYKSSWKIHSNAQTRLPWNRASLVRYKNRWAKIHFYLKESQSYIGKSHKNFSENEIIKYSSFWSFRLRTTITNGLIFVMYRVYRELKYSPTCYRRFDVFARWRRLLESASICSCNFFHGI